jgi:hypothetical protein
VWRLPAPQPVISANLEKSFGTAGVYDWVSEYDWPSLGRESLVTFWTSDRGEVWIFDEVTDCRLHIASSLRLVAERAPSQRHFWQLFNAIQFANNSAIQFASNNSAIQFAPNTSGFLHSLDFWWNSAELRDLSERDVRSILHTVADQVETFEEAQTFTEVVLCIGEVLSREVAAHVRYRRVQKHRLDKGQSHSTRDWVLGFALHTGTSPPTLGASRPAVGWALVFNTAARRLGDETVLRRSHSRGLRDPLCRGGSRARFGGGARCHMPAVGCVQSAGCGRGWPNSPLAEFPRTIWPAD